jgi:hypothetical protein
MISYLTESHRPSHCKDNECSGKGLDVNSASKCYINFIFLIHFMIDLLFFSEDWGSTFLRMVAKILIFYGPVHMDFSIHLRT